MLIEAARPRLADAKTVETETGAELKSETRTSTMTFFTGSDLFDAKLGTLLHEVGF